MSPRPDDAPRTVADSVTASVPAIPVPDTQLPESPTPEVSVAAPRAHVTVLSLGGTIFMRQDETGLRATPDDHAAEGLARAVVDGVAVTHREIANVGSPSITPAHLREVLREARAAVEAGSIGVVLTHGTDTMEESAFLLDLVWELDAPLVMTGAMRPSNAPGADGPANLRDAVRTAASDSARGLGVLVVFDGQVHLADRVTKVSSRSVDAFASEPSGPVAFVGEDDLRMLYLPVKRGLAASATPTEHVPLAAEWPGIQENGVGMLPASLPVVPVLSATLGEDGAVLDAWQPGQIRGLVIDGVGMGHVAAPMVPRLTRFVEAGVPVVISTRVHQGGTSTHHYDYPGSEVDLIAHGAVMSGRLSAHAARLLLQVLIAAGADREGVAEVFERYTT